jgi:hypothetical protein
VKNIPSLTKITLRFVIGVIIGVAGFAFVIMLKVKMPFLAKLFNSSWVGYLWAFLFIVIGLLGFSLAKDAGWRKNHREVKEGEKMCTQNDKKEVTLQDIKQDIDSLRKEMNKDTNFSALTSLFAFATTMIIFGIGLFFQQHLPGSTDTWFFILLDIAMFIVALVVYRRRQAPHKTQETERH